MKKITILCLLLLGIGLAGLQAQQRIKVKRLPIDTYEADYEGDEEGFEEPTGSDFNTGRIAESSFPNAPNPNPVNPEDLEGERSDEGSNPGCPDPSSNARMASSDNCGPCDDDVIACIKTAPGSCEYNILRTYPVSDDGCSCLFDEAPISVEKIPTENETDACGNCVPIGTEPEDLDNDKVADCNDPCIGTVNKCGKCIALGQTDTDVDKDGTPDECDPCINGVKLDGTVPNCSSHREDACHYYTDYYKIDQANCSCTQTIDHTDITDKYSFTDANGDCCDNPIDYYLNADGDNEGGSTYLGRFCTPPPNSSTTNTDQCDNLYGVYKPNQCGICSADPDEGKVVLYRDIDGNGDGDPCDSCDYVCQADYDANPKAYCGVDNDNEPMPNYYIDKDGDDHDAGLVSICHSVAIANPMYKSYTLGPDCDDDDNAIKDVYNGSVTIEEDGVEKDTVYFHTCAPNEVELTAITNPGIKNKDKIVWSGAASGAGESIKIDENNVGQIYVSICGQKFKKIEVVKTSGDILCTQVHFSGNDYYELKSDDLKNTYDAPQWADNDRDGNIERHYGVAYKRDTKPKLKAHFYSKASINSNTKVYIKATGTNGISIAQKEATVNGNEIILGETEASNSWPNTVKFYDKDNSAFELKWEIKIGNCAWKEITTTKHQVYITLDQPSTPLRQETLFKVACDKSSGASSDTSTVKGIWSDFADREVLRIDGHQLTYWQGGAASCINTETMITSGNGQCGAWAEFLIDCFKVHKIDSDKYEIQSIYFPPYGKMLVKKWTFDAKGNAPDYLKPFTHLEKEVQDDSTGVPAQGNDNPLSIFVNHYVVKYNKQFYDPSYGGSLYNTEEEWEDASLDGFEFLTKDINTNKDLTVRKKNTQKKEVIFYKL